MIFSTSFLMMFTFQMLIVIMKELEKDATIKSLWCIIIGDKTQISYLN